jgi:thiamine-monophosphate kinase
MINGVMPKTDLQLNSLNESDSEIVEFGGKKMLANIDEFSSEDMIREHDPFTLGWNVAAGAISDIYASGGRPLFYAHAMTVSDSWNDGFILKFSEGISAVLKETGTGFIGGDFGRSDTWRYTATVIGNLEGNPLLRSGASPGDAIFITGLVGAGNVEAFLKMYSQSKLAARITGVYRNRFYLRQNEALLIKKYATACIDTSDGVFNSLNIISRMSNTGYEVGNLPYVKIGVLAAKAFSIPKALLFLGECGEYELLFTVKAGDEDNMLKDAAGMGLKLYKIGKVTESGKRILYEDNIETDMGSLDVRARDFANVKEYLKTLEEFLKGNANR